MHNKNIIWFEALFIGKNHFSMLHKCFSQESLPAFNLFAMDAEYWIAFQFTTIKMEKIDCLNVGSIYKFVFIVFQATQGHRWQMCSSETILLPWNDKNMCLAFNCFIEIHMNCISKLHVCGFVGLAWQSSLKVCRVIFLWWEDICEKDTGNQK